MMDSELCENYEEVAEYVNKNTKSITDRAKKLVDYYDNTDDRDDKDFDTLDLALDLSRELSQSKNG